MSDESQHTVAHVAASGTTNTPDAGGSAAAFPTFTILSTSDIETSTIDVSTHDPVVQVELVQQPTLPIEDNTSSELSDDDALTDEERTIDREAFNDLFAKFE